MSQYFEELRPFMDRAMAMMAAKTLFEWDEETLAPEEAGKYTSKTVGVLSEEYQKAVTDARAKELLTLCEKDDTLTDAERAIVREWKEELSRLDAIPPQEYRAYAEVSAKASRIWAKAKKENDFASFAPVLKEIIGWQKKFASYEAKEDQKLYDVMLNQYEKGFNMEQLDVFFDLVKREWIPLLKDVLKKQKEEGITDDFLYGDFDEKKQEEIGRFLAEYVGFDFRKGVFATSAHPFTTNLHNHDVRITTHYTNKLDSSLFSVIHETGHAIYEMGIADELTQTPAGQGASMAMHESQSRFFENILGRNAAFWKPVYGKLQETFPDALGEVSVEQFVKAVCLVKPGLIRTEADELTYCLHVLVRYELEKMLIEDDLDVMELPKLWKEKYKEYLGVEPETDSEGVLQDIHWAGGSFGYFPSYALGSAFGAQMYEAMKKTMDVDALLEEGKIGEIRDYLRKEIHRYGKMKTSQEILKQMTGEEFNPKYYLQYLKEKYLG